MERESTLLQKLQKIQQNLKAPKGQWNDFSKFHYRSCEDILEAVKPLLHAAGMTLILTDEVVQVGERVHVKATAILADNTESAPIQVHGWAREPEQKKGMDGSQITGAASSYARKYALNGLFLIDDNKDADTVDSIELSEDQRKKIASLIKSSGADEAKFCAHLGVDSIESIPASKYKQAMEALNAKANKQRAQ